jgi:hypothetical protein
MAARPYAWTTFAYYARQHMMDTEPGPSSAARKGSRFGRVAPLERHVIDGRMAVHACSGSVEHCAVPNLTDRSIGPKLMLGPLAKLMAFMIPFSVKTPGDLKVARDFMGLSANGLARILGIEDGRSVRRWEAGDRELPGPVIVILETALGYLRKIEMISRQLDLLRSGEMHTGRNGVDDTEGSIAALLEAKKSYEEAYEILVRQPPPGASARGVHWYHLRRMTPQFEAGRKDDWSVPGELSPQASLVHFEKHEGFEGGLEICGDGDFSADFILEQRTLTRRQHGASQRLTPGDLVRTFFVRHRRSVATPRK